MSLSSWFRDYLYIPLGGNRVSAPRFVLNIMVVWILTGFWHGADWNFVLWGGFFGVLLLLEKFFLSKALGKAPKPLRHVYVIVAVLVSWVFFDAASLGGAFAAIGRMFGAGASGFAGSEAIYYLRSYAVPLVIGAAGSTPMLKRIADRLCSKKLLITVLEPLAVALILIASTAKMVDGSFNPFIYFRF